MRQTKDGWIVETDKGSIECEHVISCSGNFARQTGEMVGLDIPVIPVEHQYIVTEPHPEIQKRKKDGLPEMGVLRDSDSRWYMSCLLYTSPSPRDLSTSRMPSSA